MSAKRYGVYRTEEDCLKAPEAEGEGEASVSSASIDPWKYHQPEVAGSQCWTTRSKTSQDPCPHLWPDVRLWEDAATWPNSRVPPAWSAVTLPENTKVLISGCSLSHQDPFFSINIPSSSEASCVRLLGAFGVARHTPSFWLPAHSACYIAFVLHCSRQTCLVHALINW
eukprot:scaffold65174_cov15-Tisochrysis_lutea.AAC.1